MQNSEFENVMDKLKNVYGDRCYPNERSKLLWKFFQHFDKETFLEIVDRAIVNMFQPPSLEKLKEFGAEEIRAFYKRQEAQLEEKVSGIKCKMCDGSGVVLANKSGIGLPFMFRCPACDCAFLRRVTTSIPVWSYQEGYEVK